MLISEHDRELNAELHRRVPAYGTGGHKLAPDVRSLATRLRARTVLDYGCGKGTLAAALRGLRVFEYDPAIPGKDAPPLPAEIVVCGDVMEHVEPDFCDAVLDHVCSLGTRAVFFVIATEVGGKRLADGRPAHVNVRPAEWWAERLRARGAFSAVSCRAGEFAAVWIKGKPA